jgi:hypothetical protein
MDGEAKLVVSRTSPDDLKQRQIIVKLDGEWVGDLLYGKILARAIPAGLHTLKVDNTWNKKSLDFRAEPGEEIRFRVVNRPGKFTWFLVASLGAGPMYVSIERETSEPVSSGQP